jgi:hypothetical protein
MKIASIIGGAVFATLLMSSADAGIVYGGPTGAMPTDQSFVVNFNSAAAATTGLSFTIDGYLSLDGQNAYEDDFSLSLNGNPVLLGTFNLGGGSNSGFQANVYSNPFTATLTNPTNNGTGIGWNGGMEDVAISGLSLIQGTNQLTFTYTSLGSPDAGFQGLGDEGWGIEKVNVSAVPESSTWAMLILGFLGLGFAGYRKTKSRAVGFSTA